MSKKSSRAPNSAQGKNAKNISASVKSEYSASLKEYQAQKKAAEKARRDAAKARDKELKTVLKRARETGIYSPKGDELTNYRRRRLRKVKQEFGEYISSDKYFFIPAGKQARKKILERANSLQMQTTHTGLFIPREGHKTARLKEDKKRGEFFIERKGKTKTGVNKGRIYRDITPLASADELDKERDRLRRMAKHLGPLKDNEMLSFSVHENGVEGYSHSVFNSIEQLLAYLDTYPKSVAARVNFLRHIRIEKMSSRQWFQLHPAKSPGKKNRQRVAKGKYDTRRTK